MAESHLGDEAVQRVQRIKELSESLDVHTIVPHFARSTDSLSSGRYRKKAWRCSGPSRRIVVNYTQCVCY